MHPRGDRTEQVGPVLTTVLVMGLLYAIGHGPPMWLAGVIVVAGMLFVAMDES